MRYVAEQHIKTGMPSLIVLAKILILNLTSGKCNWLSLQDWREHKAITGDLNALGELSGQRRTLMIDGIDNISGSRLRSVNYGPKIKAVDTFPDVG